MGDAEIASGKLSKQAGLYKNPKVTRLAMKKSLDETDRLTRGYIGLQNHDSKSVLKFRNILITELKD